MQDIANEPICIALQPKAVRERADGIQQRPHVPRELSKVVGRAGAGAGDGARPGQRPGRLTDLAGESESYPDLTWGGGRERLTLSERLVLLERHVRGSFFVEYVRMIRRRKDVEWMRTLRVEDLALVQQRITPEAWSVWGWLSWPISRARGSMPCACGGIFLRTSLLASTRASLQNATPSRP